MRVFIVNNKPVKTPDDVDTVSGLLKFLNIPEGGTATAINNKIVKASERNIHKLSDNDSITIISAAYGG